MNEQPEEEAATKRSLRPEFVDDESSSDASESTETSEKNASETRGSGLFWILSFIAFIGIGLAGYGTSAGWFSFLSPAANDDAETSQIADAIGEQLDAIVSEDDSATETRYHLPPLDPFLPRDSENVLAEGQRVALHLFNSTNESLDAAEMRARFEYEFGDTKLAETLWKRIVASSPKYAYAFQGLGQLATLNGNLDQAVSYFRKALLAQPNDPTRKLSLAKALVANNSADEGQQLLESLTQSNPDYVSAQFELGQLLSSKQEFEAAKSTFLKLLELKPDHIEGNAAIASVVARLGDAESAKGYLAEHRRLRKLEQNKLKEERETYDDYSALMIDVGELYSDMAKVYLGNQNNQAAELLLARAARMAPESVEPRQAMAWISMNKGRTFETIRWLTQVSQLNPDDFTPVTEIARLQLELGALDDARVVVEDFLETNPNSSKALQFLSSYHLEVSENLEEALTNAERLVKTDESANSYAWLATIREARQEIDLAVEALSTALELESSNTQYAQRLAILKESRTTKDEDAQPNE